MAGQSEIKMEPNVALADSNIAVGLGRTPNIFGLAPSTNNQNSKNRWQTVLWASIKIYVSDSENCSNKQGLYICDLIHIYAFNEAQTMCSMVIVWQFRTFFVNKFPIHTNSYITHEYFHNITWWLWTCRLVYMSWHSNATVMWST